MRIAALAILVCSVLLTGCASKEEGGTVVGAVAGGAIGSQFGRGSGNVVATVAGAVVGGIIGNNIGKSLDARDRELAANAEYDAWERGAPRQPVRWRNPASNRYGEVEVEEYYERGPSRCRNFVHRVWIDGRPQTMRGIACRSREGTWRQVE